MEGEMAKQRRPPHTCLLSLVFYDNLSPHSVSSSYMGEKKYINQTVLVENRKKMQTRPLSGKSAHSFEAKRAGGALGCPT